MVATTETVAAILRPLAEREIEAAARALVAAVGPLGVVAQ